jgi:hypothetical protein
MKIPFFQGRFCLKLASPQRKEITYGICFSSKKRNHLWNLLLLQEKKSPMEFASPPRKKSPMELVLIE